MEVGILTYHTAYNEGAILQCQAAVDLWRIHGTTSVVDYQHPQREEYYQRRWPERAYLKTYAKNVLPLGRMSFVDNDPSAMFTSVSQSYDCLVIGSDEVWKFAPENSSSIRLECRLPNAWWPDERVGCYKVAYAADVGSSCWRNLPDQLVAEIGKILTGYYALSVRNQNTLQFLEAISPDLAARAKIICDPMFCWENEVDLDLLKHKVGWSSTRPMVCVYGRLKRPVRLNLKTFKGVIVAADTLKLSPPEWFALPKISCFVVTQKMHGLIAALRANTPCWVEDERTKTQELVNQFRLPTKKSCRVIEEQWPYDLVYDTCARLAEDHRAYLKQLFVPPHVL
jgi:hypothetical protein